MPKMKISKLMFYSTVLTSVMLSSCSQHAQTHSTVENTASNYAQNAATYWTELPFCSGRYQINLPTNRISGTGWLRYNNWQIKVQPDYWNGMVESVSEVQKNGYNGNESFIENRTLIPNKAIAMVTQASASWDSPLLTQVNGDTEMPQQQGVCLTEGFIADKGSEPFFGSAGIKIKDYKDVYAELMTGGSLEEGDKPLLERDLFAKDSAWDKLLSWAKYSTIREGKRDINGMAGNEKLVKWQGKRYLFIWEKDDGSVRFKMTLGTNKKNTKGSPLSEKEALTAWDAILPTLKKRL